MARRGTGLMVIGAVLLLLSVGSLGYSRFVEWQHASAVAALAPPEENLPTRLELPTATARP